MTKVTLAQLDKMNEPEMSEISSENLATLVDGLTEMKERMEKLNAKIFQEQDRRFSRYAENIRTQEGKMTGTVRFVIDGYTIVADSPIAIKWDQEKLKETSRHLVQIGEDPYEYISFTMKVSESKHKAWTAKTRDLFEHARTVSFGKPSYKMIPLES